MSAVACDCRDSLVFGVVVESVTTPACHVGVRGFEPRPSRHFGGPHDPIETSVDLPRGAVGQLADKRPFKPIVPGSSPGRPTPFPSVAQPGSAQALGACGQRFKSSRSDHFFSASQRNLPSGAGPGFHGTATCETRIGKPRYTPFRWAREGARFFVPIV